MTGKPILHTTGALTGTLVLTAALAAGAAAQGRVVPPPPPGRDTVVAAPGPRYAAGELRRFLLGDEWRDLWQVPLTLPVLDIETFAGGLEPDEEGGGNQSITLHLRDARGRDWIFRSLDKYPGKKLEEGGLLAWIAADQVSALHPAGQLVVPTLLDALGILHVTPTLYVMPDDPALGKFRSQFAGMIGALELIPNEGADDSPGFAGSKKIVKTETLFDHLGETPLNRVDQRELFRARLLDFIIGDTDRGLDQWRWARFPDPQRADGRIWRPIPRDRDWAFVSGDGVAGAGIGLFYPKHTAYRARYADLQAYTFTSHILDRRLLTSIDRADAEAEIQRVRSALTDSVIRAAVGHLPRRYPESHRQRLTRLIESRRDRLPGIGNAYYQWLASAVDIRATQQPDYARAERRADGSVDVALFLLAGAEDAGRAAEPYYRRTFRPSETHEIRIHLRDGDDRALVRGASNDEIAIRVIGDAGDDVLVDSTSGANVHFYDARGENRFITAAGTSVSTRAWNPPPIPEGVRLGSDWSPDFGQTLGWRPAAEYGEHAGVVVGFGPRWTGYGFRRLPHEWQVGGTALFALGALRPGASAFVDWRPENSLHSLHADARWSTFDAIRWYGPGNSSPRIDDDLSLVPLRRASIRPDLILRFGTWRAETSPDSLVINEAAISDETPSGFRTSLALGPVLTWTDPAPRTPADGSPDVIPPGAPSDQGRALAAGTVFQAGAGARFDLSQTDRAVAPRRGYLLSASAQGFPGFGRGDAGASGNAAAEIRAYFPLPAAAVLATRIGAAGAFGDFTAWNAATLGGRANLRGYPYMRFAGDAAAYGNLEIRAPIASVPLIVRGKLGLLALADAGRVWFRGRSPGGFHTALGGGIWFAGGGEAVSLYYAHGERGRLYLSFDMPF